MRYVLRPYTFLPYVFRVNRFKQDGHITNICLFVLHPID